MKALVIVTLLAAAAAEGAVIPNVTITPIDIPSPRTINPDVITLSGEDIIFFDTAFQQMGRIDPNGLITVEPLRANEGETVSVKNATPGPDGATWIIALITNQGTSTFRSGIARVSQQLGLGVFFTIPRADACDRISAPCDIVSGPGDALWFTQGTSGFVGRLTTAGVFSEFPVTQSTINRIAHGPDDNTVSITSATSNRVFRMAENGNVTVNTRVGAGRDFVGPLGIARGPDGSSVAVTESSTGSGGNRIAIIDLAGAVTEFPIPTSNSMPEAIVLGSDGKFYFTERGAKQIGQFDPATGQILESPIPNGFIPEEILALPPSVSGNVRLIVNTRDPVTFDLTPQRVEIQAPAAEPKPLLTVTKRSVNTLTRVDPDDPNSTGIVRQGSIVVFELLVRNAGTGFTTGPWSVRDTPTPPDKCGVPFEGGTDGFIYTPPESRFIPQAESVVISPEPGSANFVLQPGQQVAIKVACFLGFQATAHNRAEVSGGGSVTTSDTETVILLEKAAGERILKRQLARTKGRSRTQSN